MVLGPSSHITIEPSMTPDVTLNDITQFNNLLLDVNFDKSTVGLHYIHILSMLAEFHGDQRLIIMLSINCLIQVFVV